MEFDLKVHNEMDFFFKLDKDLAAKLLSSQKAPRPTFSTCFKVTPKGPGTCPGERDFPRDCTSAAFPETHAPQHRQ